MSKFYLERQEANLYLMLVNLKKIFKKLYWKSDYMQTWLKINVFVTI